MSEVDTKALKVRGAEVVKVLHLLTQHINAATQADATARRFATEGDEIIARTAGQLREATVLLDRMGESMGVLSEKAAGVDTAAALLATGPRPPVPDDAGA